MLLVTFFLFRAVVVSTHRAPFFFLQPWVYFFFVALAYAAASFLAHPEARHARLARAQLFMLHVKKTDHSCEKEAFVFWQRGISRKEVGSFYREAAPKRVLASAWGPRSRHYRVPSPWLFPVALGKGKKKNECLWRRKKKTERVAL